MPATLVDWLPLPNFKVYSAGSVLLFSVAVYYAINVTSDPTWRVNAMALREETMIAQAKSGAVDTPKLLPPLISLDVSSNATDNFNNKFIEVVAFMMQEPLCMWAAVNACAAGAAAVWLVVRRAAFGRLRATETHRLRDRFWNYAFYKFIFVFGVLNVQYVDEVLLWIGWFTALGALHLLTQLCKDRFEYVWSARRGAGADPGSGAAGAALAWLLTGAVLTAGALLVLAARRTLPHSPHTFVFMASECLVVLVSALHAAARQVLERCGTPAGSPSAYYTHLCFDSTRLVVETLQAAHAVAWSRAALSLASLVLLLQLRQLLHELRARLRRHARFAATRRHITDNYPMASRKEVEERGDPCAICWEPLRDARKLPCDHLFHNSCLCQWVQHDASCPTCRRALAGAAPRAPLDQDDVMPAPPRPPNHLFHLDVWRSLAGRGVREPQTPGRPPRRFHLDGSRYVWWLPSLSVEVRRAPSPVPSPLEPTDAALDNAALETQPTFLGGAARAENANSTEAGAGPSERCDIVDAAANAEHDASDLSSNEEFAESSARREERLARRKRRLLLRARKRYLARGAGPAPPSDS